MEPGRVRFQTSKSIDQLPESWGDNAIVRIKLLAAGGRKPLAIEIPMKRTHDTLCVFDYEPESEFVYRG